MDLEPAELLQPLLVISQPLPEEEVMNVNEWNGIRSVVWLKLLYNWIKMYFRGRDHELDRIFQKCFYWASRITEKICTEFSWNPFSVFEEIVVKLHKEIKCVSRVKITKQHWIIQNLFTVFLTLLFYIQTASNYIFIIIN